VLDCYTRGPSDGWNYQWNIGVISFLVQQFPAHPITGLAHLHQGLNFGASELRLLQ